MATKAQKKAEKAKRKSKKKQGKSIRSVTPAKRLALRLAKQSPVGWSGEMDQDVAIFDDQTLESLATEDQQHARLIRDAFKRVCQKEGAAALESLAVINRRSIFAQWRTFLRGLVDWNDGNLSSAQETWARLDNQRRPARIAMALLLAHRDDLTTLESNPSEVETQMEWFGPIDKEAIYHAKLVRKRQIDRTAIRAASGITRVPKTIGDALVTPSQIEWLRDFSAEHRLTEPELVQSMHEVTLLRAFCSQYVDVFEDAVKHLRGPRHDRRNNLLRYQYEFQYERSAKADEWLRQYLQEDLPNNPELSPSLRGAIASMIYMAEAATELTPQNSPSGPFGGGFNPFFSAGPDFDRAMKLFDLAVEAHPTNRSAWKSYQATLNDLADDERINKPEREARLKKRALVHERWVNALPDDIEPRMALVDYLLDHDRSDEAKKQVDWLSGTRREDPLADAVSWRWSVLEAMRLCRRKAAVPQANEILDQAERQWPKWLSNDWLPYLRAATAMRDGDASAMKELGSPQYPITTACMKLGAAQRMHVPAAALKPLRAAVDDRVKNIEEATIEDLLQVASFYWDLHRSKLKYPAMRMHGTKFLWQLCETWDDNPQSVTKRLDDPLVRSALLAMTREGMFNDRYDVLIRKWMEVPPVSEHMTIVASTALAASQRKVQWKANEQADLIKPLRDAAIKEDRFYSHFYNDLANRLETGIKESKRFDPGNFFSGFDRSDNELCNCDKCRAARGEIFE